MGNSKRNYASKRSKSMGTNQWLPVHTGSLSLSCRRCHAWCDPERRCNPSHTRSCRWSALGTGSIDRGEAESFLLAAVGLIAVGASGAALSNFPGIGETYLKPIVQNIAVFVAPAVVLVALETIWRAGSVRLS